MKETRNLGGGLIGGKKDDYFSFSQVSKYR